MASATTPLEWLIPALATASPGTVRGLGTRVATEPLFEVRLHDVQEMAGWSTMGRHEDTNRASREAVARLVPLPPIEPLAPDDQDVEKVVSRIEYTYPQMASVSVRASMAASEFKGVYDFTRDPEQRRARPRASDFNLPTPGYTPAITEEAARKGIIVHRVLQHLDFVTAVRANGVASELHRMVGEGLITVEETALVDRTSINWRKRCRPCLRKEPNCLESS
jgi:ATP-dependent exoDNAse (exonuclease V) beta subunit